MSTQYQVNVQLSQPTLQALLQNGFSLFAFKAVQASGGGGVPLVWYRTSQFYSNTSVAWSEAYQAYTSTTQIVTGATVTPGFSAPISPGQTLNVTTPSGGGQVTPGGPAQAISIMNQTRQPFTCGVAQPDPNGNSVPVCALPLYPNFSDTVAPSPKVLLIFSNVPLNPGTVVQPAFGAGVLVNLADSPVQTVTFDIDNGWTCDGGNCRFVQPGQPLQPILPYGG